MFQIRLNWINSKLSRPVNKIVFYSRLHTVITDNCSNKHTASRQHRHVILRRLVTIINYLSVSYPILLCPQAVGHRTLSWPRVRPRWTWWLADLIRQLVLLLYQNDVGFFYLSSFRNEDVTYIKVVFGCCFARDSQCIATPPPTSQIISINLVRVPKTTKDQHDQRLYIFLVCTNMKGVRKTILNQVVCTSSFKIIPFFSHFGPPGSQTKQPVFLTFWKMCELIFVAQLIWLVNLLLIS